MKKRAQAVSIMIPGGLVLALLTLVLEAARSAWGAPGPADKNPFVPAGTNSPPIISSIGPQIITEDTTTAPLAFTIHDNETPASDLTLTFVSSNLTLVPATNYAFGGSGSARTVTVIPAPNQFGTGTVTVAVSDGELSASSTFTLTVLGVNDAPTISNPGMQTVLQGHPTDVLPLTIGDVETAADHLTLSASSTNAVLVRTNDIVFGGSGSNRTVQIFPRPNTNGTTLITITVADTNNGATSTIFRLDVTPGVPPAIVSQPQALSVAMNSDASFKVTATGALPLSYQWLGAGVALAGATNSILSFSRARPPLSGNYYVTVSNPYGSVTSDVARLIVALVPRGAVWKYHDTGGNSISADWRLPDFDDSGWTSNRAEFGYGDGDEATVVSYGGDLTNKYITTYFRLGFAVESPALSTNVLLRLLRDDGAVVYLNGLEVRRDNLPPGDILDGTLALTAVEGTDERTFFETALSPMFLRYGWNVLAVEVHQNASDSPDLSFDLEVVGSGEDVPLIMEHPQSQTVPLGTNLTLRVTPAGLGPFTYLWQLNGISLAGASNNTYFLPSVQPEHCGSYRVIVFNALGAIASDTAVVQVGIPVDSGGDAFDSATPLSGANGVQRGESSGATKQPGEPRHANKDGGKSVWHVWTPTDSGIASLDTRGSSFDTLLAVYTGSTLSNLTLVASDEDSGGYYTSSLQFNAEANRPYYIAVDGVGFGGAGGPYVIRWSLIPTADRVPVILHGPASQGVQEGGTAMFSVLADPSNANYQWFFNGKALPGETGPELFRVNVGPKQVGRYTVQVSSGPAPPVFSEPAVLHVGSQPDFFAFDKLEDLFPGGANGGGSGLAFRAGAAANDFAAAAFALPPASGTLNVRFGFSATLQAAPGRESASDPLPGLHWGPGSLWFAIHSEDTLPIEIDTAGSKDAAGADLPVRIAVYESGPLLTFLTSPSGTLTTFDYDPGTEPGHRPCHVIINPPANGTVSVLLVLDRFSSDLTYPGDAIRVNVRTQPKPYFSHVGASILLPLPAALVPPPGVTMTRYLRRNGQVLRTNPAGESYPINPIHCEDSGTYDMLTVTNSISYVQPFALLFVNTNLHTYLEQVMIGDRPFIKVTSFASEAVQLQRMDGNSIDHNSVRWINAGATYTTSRTAGTPLIFYEELRRDETEAGHWFRARPLLPSPSSSFVAPLCQPPRLPGR